MLNPPEQSGERIAVDPEPSLSSNVRTIAVLTLASRVLGLVREQMAAHFFGAGAVWSAFSFGFQFPNAFRRLFSEGTLGSAFLPLYAQMRDRDPVTRSQFVSSGVALVFVLSGAVVLVLEAAVVIALMLGGGDPHQRLALKLAGIMIPYIAIMSMGAILGAVLQVHRIFGPPAALPIVLNVVQIVGIGAAAWTFSLADEAEQVRGAHLVAGLVVMGAAIQLWMLLPSLRRCGFSWVGPTKLFSPEARQILWLSLPVAGAAVIFQVSSLLDRGLAIWFSPEAAGAAGSSWRYPLEAGAAARLNWSQFLYQFPLGVVASAIASAAFPRMAEAWARAKPADLVAVLVRSLRLTLLVSVPCSVGLVIVRHSIVQVLFEHGRFTPHDTELVAGTVLYYGAGVWVFSLLLVLTRAMYAMRDMRTPAIMATAALGLNLAFQLPLLWVVGERALAMGYTLGSLVQLAWMMLVLRRRLDIRWRHTGLWVHARRVVVAAATMAAAAAAMDRWVPTPSSHAIGAARLLLTILVCAGVFTLAGMAMGLKWREETA